MKPQTIIISILIVSLASIAFYYYDRTATLEVEKSFLQYQIQKLKKSTQKTWKEKDTFGRPSVSLKERGLFEDQYKQEAKCLNPRNDTVMVECVDTKRKAMYEWVEEYRKNNS